MWKNRPKWYLLGKVTVERLSSMLDPKKEDEDFKELSNGLRGSIKTLIQTVDSINKNREELEQQKQLIRSALTQGRYDILEQERAKQLYQNWNAGIQMVPLYPTDYVPPMSQRRETVQLYPLKRDWVQVAPPDLFPNRRSAYPLVGIAGYRVRPLAPLETVTLDQAVLSVAKSEDDPTDTSNLSDQIAKSIQQINKRFQNNVANQYQRIHLAQDVPVSPPLTYIYDTTN